MMPAHDLAADAARLVAQRDGTVDRYPYLRVAANGEVALLYTAGRGTMLYKAAQGSATFGAETRVKESTITGSLAYLSDGRILVAWAPRTPDGPVFGVYCQ